MTSQSARQGIGPVKKWSLFFAAAIFAASSGLYASSEEEYENTQNQEDPYPVDGPADMLPMAANEILMDVDKVGSKYVAVGLRGHVLISDDAVNWSQSPSPTRSGLNAVAFADSNNGNAVGHDAVIIRTTDGGKTWTKQLYAPELERPFLDVQMFDGGKGFAVGAYGLNQPCVKTNGILTRLFSLVMVRCYCWVKSATWRIRQTTVRLGRE